MKLKLQWLLASALLLLISSCDKDKDHSNNIEKSFDITGATKILSKNGYKITVTKGNEYSFKAKGPAEHVNDLVVTRRNGGFIDIQYEHTVSNRPFIEINITMPDLVQINLSAASQAVINGYEDDNHVLRAMLSSASKCTINGAPINVAVDISNASQLDINGTTDNLYGAISDAGKLNAYNLTSKEVDIEASIGSEAKVKVVEKLFASALTGSRIYYKGDPAVKSIEASDGGQVIKE
jgi:hypothetical protein